MTQPMRETRRAELARVVWRVVERDGVRAATVRAVAREAGVSMGSLRHSFTTQDELRRFAMRELIGTVTDRIRSRAAGRVGSRTATDARDAALALLSELLPLDEQRRTEARIYTAFVAEAGTDAGIAAIRDQADQQLRGQCEHVLTSLADLGHLGAGRDLAVETERLWSLLDGLTAHLLARPRDIPAGRVRAVLRVHLTDLTGPAEPDAGKDKDQ